MEFSSKEEATYDLLVNTKVGEIKQLKYEMCRPKKKGKAGQKEEQDKVGGAPAYATPKPRVQNLPCLGTILNLFLFLLITTKNFMMCHIQKKVTQRGKILAINLVHLPTMTQHQAHTSEYQKQEHLGCLE